MKRRKQADLHAYHRRKQANRARVESAMRQKAREEQASENAAREEAAMEQAARADAELGTNTVEVSGSSSLSVATQTNLSTEDVEYNYGEKGMRGYSCSRNCLDTRFPGIKL